MALERPRDRHADGRRLLVNQYGVSDERGRESGGLGQPLLVRAVLIVLPLGLLALSGAARVATGSVLVLYVLLYACFTYLLPAYGVVVAPVCFSTAA